MASKISIDRPIPKSEDTNVYYSLKLRPQKVLEFSDAMLEIERFKRLQLEKLTKSLKIEKLPTSVDITDPALLPLLSPKVRAVVIAFPHQVEEIIKRHGLNSEEFNGMLRSAKSNPFFRWRVQANVRHD